MRTLEKKAEGQRLKAEVNVIKREVLIADREALHTLLYTPVCDEFRATVAMASVSVLTKALACMPARCTGKRAVINAQLDELLPARKLQHRHD